MEDLKEKILNLQQQSEVLEPDTFVREKLLETVSKYLVDFVDRLNSDPAYSNVAVDHTKLELSQSTMTLEKILNIFNEEVANKGIRASSGKHLGYIPGGGIFASTLGDMLAATTNAYTGINYASPGGAAIETVVLDWMKEIFYFPKHSIGHLTSGGSIANLTALTAARDKHKIKGINIERSVIYVSEQIHHCINKALRIIGLEDVIIRYIKLDAHYRLVTSDLEQKIKEDKASGYNPFLVAASAGTTDTGAIDPLHDIAKVAKRHQLWFHIDAAYGGFFILVESIKQRLKGIELADSLVVDPHKCLFLPYGIGAVLIKDRDAAWQSFHYTANYMQDSNLDDGRINTADISPELTKHFRAMRMWLPMQLYGIEPFVACLEEKVYLIQYMRRELVKHQFEVGPEPDLTVSYFWIPTANGDHNLLNEKYLELIHQDGRVYFSSTVLHGKFVIRIAILSFRTKMHHINEAVEMLVDIRTALQRENSE